MAEHIEEDFAAWGSSNRTVTFVIHKAPDEMRYTNTLGEYITDEGVRFGILLASQGSVSFMRGVRRHLELPTKSADELEAYAEKLHEALDDLLVKTKEEELDLADTLHSYLAGVIDWYEK